MTDEFRSVARSLGVGVELHYLDVPTEELWRRIVGGTPHRPGVATRSLAFTSTSGPRPSKYPLQTNCPYSIRHRFETATEVLVILSRPLLVSARWSIALQTLRTRMPSGLTMRLRQTMRMIRFIGTLSGHFKSEEHVQSMRGCWSCVTRKVNQSSNLVSTYFHSLVIKQVKAMSKNLPIAIRLCQETASPKVLRSGLSALGWFRDRRALPIVLQHSRHPDVSVRDSVVHALPKLAGDPADPAVTDALITLMLDDSALVRNWATFGLGTALHSDSSEIRAALWLRVDDEDPEIVLEALRGLGARRVPGVVNRVVEVLGRRPVSSYYIDAAVEMPDRRLVKPLELIFATEFDEEISAKWLTDVISNCSDSTFEESG